MGYPSMIHWNQFDWQSFATLITGLSAVCGATLIGLKQMRLGEASLKAELFDRRMSCYSAIVQYVEYVLSHDVDEVKSPKDYPKSYINQYSSAVFLFSESTMNVIREIDYKGNRYVTAVKLIHDAREFSEMFSEGELDKLKLEAEEFRTWFLYNKYSLYKTFYPEMKFDSR
jgi:hypothetical protein